MVRFERWVALMTLLILQIFVVAAAVVVVLRPQGLTPAPIPPAPAVRQQPVAHASPVLSGDSQGGAPKADALAARLSGPMKDSRLGGRVAAMVTDVRTGKPLYARRQDAGATPASTTKLVTAVAALAALGPDARLRTRVVEGSKRGSIVLVGGGDPMVAGPAAAKDDYPEWARLSDLAAKTAKALKAKSDNQNDKKSKIKIFYDDSLFEGSSLGPGWKPNYVTEGSVAPITALKMDDGLVSPRTSSRRTKDPAGVTAQAFARLLAKEGVKTAKPRRAKAPAQAEELAGVDSPPVSVLVEHMLTESDNDVAEALARQIALAQGRPASFEGAADAVTKVLAGLGVSDGVEVNDGSGLSTRNRLTAEALTSLVALAASDDHPELRYVISGLPVAGFTGTLHDRYGSGKGAGAVRAKTGTLAKVSTLAGVARTADGRLLAFAFLADQAGTAAREPLDKLATILASCGC